MALLRSVAEWALAAIVVLSVIIGVNWVGLRYMGIPPVMSVVETVVSLALSVLVAWVIHPSFREKFKRLPRQLPAPVRSSKTKTRQRTRKLLFIAGIFLPPNLRDSALGDMEEIYQKDVTRFGENWAQYLLCRDIVCSNFPLILGLGRRITNRVLKIIGLYEFVRRFLG